MQISLACYLLFPPFSVGFRFQCYTDLIRTLNIPLYFYVLEQCKMHWINHFLIGLVELLCELSGMVAFEGCNTLIILTGLMYANAT